MWSLLRQLKPSILHTYNLAAVEYALVAMLAGVPVRIHAEHGRNADDPNGTNPKHRLLRRALAPFIDTFVVVSKDLQQWLHNFVGIADAKNRFIPNGVDTAQFCPLPPSVRNAIDVPQWPADCFVIGTVGRVQDVKNQHGLIDAFLQLRRQLDAAAAMRLRLAIVGDGPLLPAIRQRVIDEGIAELVWLPGARTDIMNIMGLFSVFALPSIAEGTPVTILEAMASGLPVVATRVGGIPEVVTQDVTGMLVPPNQATELANALLMYFNNPNLRQLHGQAARAYVERHASVTAMVTSYLELYDALCLKKKPSMEQIKSCAE